MRETTTGWQHVGWIDMNPEQTGHQRCRHCTTSPQTVSWEGIATEAAALADSPAVFTGGTQPFHRALPQVVSGEPVPPPYHTVFLRYRAADADDAVLIAEESTTVFVPQVVRISWDADALTECEEDFHTQGTAEHAVLLYRPGPNGFADRVQAMPGVVRSIFPAKVNLRVVTSEVLGRHKLVRIQKGNINSPRGLTSTDPLHFRNVNPSGTCDVFVGGMQGSIFNGFVAMGDDAAAGVFPVDGAGMAVLISKSVCHELGHTLGLVSPYLGGFDSHNSNPVARGEIMNRGSSGRLLWSLGDAATWRPLNAQYLEFLLPGG